MTLNDWLFASALMLILGPFVTVFALKKEWFVRIARKYGWQFVLASIYWGSIRFFYNHEELVWAIAGGVWMGLFWVWGTNVVESWIDRHWVRFKERRAKQRGRILD